MAKLKVDGAKTDHESLLRWIKSASDLCEPDSIYMCDGSQEEYDRLCELMVKNGTFVRLNEEKRPNSYLCRSDPRDVARVEHRTFICSQHEEDAGATNNWADPGEMNPATSTPPSRRWTPSRCRTR